MSLTPSEDPGTVTMTEEELRRFQVQDELQNTTIHIRGVFNGQMVDLVRKVNNMHIELARFPRLLMRTEVDEAAKEFVSGVEAALQREPPEERPED